MLDEKKFSSEVHLLIIWGNASKWKSTILEDLSTNVEIKCVYKVTWSDQLFSRNLTRFYGQHLPAGSDKELHIGKLAFHVVIVEDKNPIYANRSTTRGECSVNINIFDLKQKYREMTGGGHMIHATNNTHESKHDLWLLFKKKQEYFIDMSAWDGAIIEISNDLLGARGWRDINELFETLNHLTKYVVLRNFEQLPEKYHLDNHDDIDLLAESLDDVVYVSNARKAFEEDYRVHYFINIAGVDVPFDFRHLGDGYYHSGFQSKIINEAFCEKDSFYRPSKENYFFSLLYHAILHKKNFTCDYKNRLIKLSCDINVHFDGTVSCGMRLLSSFFYTNDFSYTRPADLSVIYRSDLCDLYQLPRPLVNDSIKSIVDSVSDLGVLSDELRPHCTDWPSLYHLSGTRANILRPFEDDLRGDILEIGAGCGAITRYLGECGGNVLALEGSPRRASIARSRTRDLNNVTIVSDKFEDFQCGQKFDVVTLIGVLEYANLFTIGDNPTLSMLERVRTFLKPNGKLIIAIENQLGLKYFAGAPEDHVGVPMYGIEGRYRKDQAQTFGRKELASLIGKAGFASSDFLAPFPDYKLPASIVTERGIKSSKFDAAALAAQSANRDPQLPNILAFSPYLTWPIIFNNEIALDLANSFLIVATPAECHELISPNILAYHYTTSRRSNLCKSAVFVELENNEIELRYRRLDRNAGNPVIGTLLKHYLPECDRYRDGTLLANEWIRVVTNEGWRIDELAELLRDWLQFIVDLSAEQGINVDISTPYSQLPGNLFDYLPQNVILSSDGKLFVIDNEWIFEDKLEVGYLVLRALLSLLHSVRKFGQPENSEIKTLYTLVASVMNALWWSVSQQDIARWISIECRLQSEVVYSRVDFDAVMDWLKNSKIPVFSLGQALAERNVQIEILNQLITKRDNQISSLLSQNSGLLSQNRIQLNEVLHSKSWRLTRPLRFAARLIRHGLTNQDRQRIGQALRNRYHRLPLPKFVKQLVSFTYHKVIPKFIRLLTRQHFRIAQFHPPSYKPVVQRLENPDYVVWGVVDWHFRHQRPQQLALALAATGRRVFYISSELVDDERAGFAAEALDASGQLFQIKLFTKGAPPIYSGAPTLENVVQLRRSIGEVLGWADCKQIVSLVDHPFWYDTASVLPNSRLIYDCMDHHEGFGNNAESLMQLEKQLLSDAELTITTSTWLDDAIAPHAKHRALIRNAGEYEHFAKVPDSIYRDPQGRRVIGYYGAIAEWFDLDLVEIVARQHPDCSVLLIGADSVNARSRLAKLPNVTFTGEVPYSELPHYLHGFDVCLLPFKVIPLTLATNPVKAYEYLGAGKPIVTVALPEMAQFEGLVYVADGKDAFLAAVSSVLSQPESDDLIQQRKIFAAGQTWQHRVEVLIHQAESSARDAKVSVIVVTYNNLELTRECLESLDEHSQYENLEIIVVDNASSDETPAFLSEWAASGENRRLILNDDNRGFAAANNQGLAVANGEYLVLLNNDTYVTPGWIRTLVRHLQRDKTIGLIGPVTNNIGNEAKIDITYDSMDEMRLKSAAYTRRRIGQAYPLRTAAFFCVMMPRATYERVGTLDEAFGRGFFEDDDYCRRIEQLGLRVALAMDVFIHHHLSASFNKLKQKDRQKLFEENKKIYEVKWGRWVPHEYRNLELPVQLQPEIVPDVFIGQKYIVGHCVICGKDSQFFYQDVALWRESLNCQHCRSTSRYRSIARGLLRAINELTGLGKLHR